MVLAMCVHNLNIYMFFFFLRLYFLELRQIQKKPCSVYILSWRHFSILNVSEMGEWLQYCEEYIELFSFFLIFQLACSCTCCNLNILWLNETESPLSLQTKVFALLSSCVFMALILLCLLPEQSLPLHRRFLCTWVISGHWILHQVKRKNLHLLIF